MSSKFESIEKALAENLSGPVYDEVRRIIYGNPCRLEIVNSKLNY
jgi:hypothetical protein